MSTLNSGPLHFRATHTRLEGGGSRYCGVPVRVGPVGKGRGCGSRVGLGVGSGGGPPTVGVLPGGGRQVTRGGRTRGPSRLRPVLFGVEGGRSLQSSVPRPLCLPSSPSFPRGRPGLHRVESPWVLQGVGWSRGDVHSFRTGSLKPPILFGGSTCHGLRLSRIFCFCLSAPDPRSSAPCTFLV